MNKKRFENFLKKVWKLRYFLIIAIIVMALMGTFLQFKTGNIYYCVSCSDCNNKLSNANSGDTIQLIQNINNHNGTCINFNDKNNVIFDCQGNIIEGDSKIEYPINDYGIYLGNSRNNIIKNCILKEFFHGVFVESSSNNTLTNITTNSNSNIGIYLQSSSNNTLTNIISQENYFADIYVFHDSCQNNFQDIIGSGNRTIEYYNYPAKIENKVLSELILCNADNSIIDNITIKGSDILKNNMLYLINTDNTTIINVNSSNNYDGIFLELSSNNILKNIIAISNNNGIHFLESSNNILTNIISTLNSDRGLYLFLANNNTFTNITSNLNSFYDIWIGTSNNNVLTNVKKDSIFIFDSY
jgi:parallel beta-helix repeat protein